VKGESTVSVEPALHAIAGQEAILYAGAGVTIDSIPEREWEEIEL